MGYFRYFNRDCQCIKELLTLSSMSAATMNAVGYEENCWYWGAGASFLSYDCFKLASPGEMSKLDEWLGSYLNVIFY